MFGIFIDIIVVCFIIGLVIVLSGVWLYGVKGVEFIIFVFNLFSNGWGEYVVVIGLVLFVFIIILGWSYYSECCIEFLFGIKVIMFF